MSPSITSPVILVGTPKHDSTNVHAEIGTGLLDILFIGPSPKELVVLVEASVSAGVLVVFLVRFLLAFGPRLVGSFKTDFEVGVLSVFWFRVLRSVKEPRAGGTKIVSTWSFGG
jgi:hypothetical protein